MTRRKWLQQFTMEEYVELLAMATIEPVGPDRNNLYMSMVLFTLSMGKADIGELMFNPLSQEEKWARYLDTIQGAKHGTSGQS